MNIKPQRKVRKIMNARIFQGVLEDGFFHGSEDEADIGGIGSLRETGNC